jgi:signal recognition particle subunit SEC65
MSKIDNILQRAYESLDLFYSRHGDSSASSTKNTKPIKKYDYQKTIICRYPGCTQEITVKGGRKYCPTHSDLKSSASQLKYESKRRSDNDYPNGISIDLNNISAKGIVDFVKEKTGYAITISIKSKKNIIKHAEQKLKEAGFNFRDSEDKSQEKRKATSDIFIGRQISLMGKSAKEIIDIVKEKTGYHITVSEKSKRSVLQHAARKLKEKGFHILLN